MKVRELMTKDVISVRPDASLREAAALLVEHRVSGLPVVIGGGEVVGVLSEADIVAKASGGTTDGGLLSWLFDPELGQQKVAARTAVSIRSIAIGTSMN